MQNKLGSASVLRVLLSCPRGVVGKSQQVPVVRTCHDRTANTVHALVLRHASWPLALHWEWCHDANDAISPA